LNITSGAYHELSVDQETDAIGYICGHNSAHSTSCVHGSENVEGQVFRGRNVPGVKKGIKRPEAIVLAHGQQTAAEHEVCEWENEQKCLPKAMKHEADIS